MQLTLEGKTTEQVAIERLQQHEPTEGYYLAFSGGKDSMCIYHLALQAGVKFDAHYSVTGIDPPELVQFIKKNYPTVKFEMPKRSFWRGIEYHGLPTRLHRWCCADMKEIGGIGRSVLTGIRWEESAKRKLRPMYEVGKKKTMLCPIIDWSMLDVWDYIDSHQLPYCSLYDTYSDRLGCVMCPMAGPSERARATERYPKIVEAWKRASYRYFDNYGVTNHRGVNSQNKPNPFKNAEDYWQWWLSGKSIKEYTKQNQGVML